MKPAVLITGAARRIGAEIARQFGAAGWHVIIHHGDSLAEAEALAASLPSAETVQCDLADNAAAESMIEALAIRHPDWRALINCAAVFDWDGPEALDARIYAEAMQVNAAAPVRLTQAFLARARAKGGRRAICLTDMKIANPNPDFFSYSMAKNALAAAVRMLAMAANDPADRIYGIAPGAILPSFDQTDEEQQRSGRMNLLGRMTGADEIAEAALFLSQGWLKSGETLFIDSGQHLLSQPRDVLYLARQ